MRAGDAPPFSRSVQKKKPRDNWTMVSLTMPGLSLSPLGVAVKHIIRAMNALAGARARRTKKPLSLRGLIISQQLYRGIYASGNGGGEGVKMDSCSQATYYQLTSLPPTGRARGVNKGVWRKHLSRSDTACQLGFGFRGCGVSKLR